MLKLSKRNSVTCPKLFVMLLLEKSYPKYQFSCYKGTVPLINLMSIEPLFKEKLACMDNCIKLQYFCL